MGYLLEEERPRYVESFVIPLHQESLPEGGGSFCFRMRDDAEEEGRIPRGVHLPETTVGVQGGLPGVSMGHTRGAGRVSALTR